MSSFRHIGKPGRYFAERFLVQLLLNYPLQVPTTWVGTKSFTFSRKTSTWLQCFEIRANIKQCAVIKEA